MSEQLSHPLYLASEKSIVPMRRSRSELIKLLVGFAVIFLVAQFTGSVLDTCHDGACSGSLAEVLRTFILPIVWVGTAVVVELLFFKSSWSQAIRELGFGRPRLRVVLISLLACLPALAFFPLFTQVTHTSLGLAPHWPWILLSVAATNGIAEEVLFRGFLFRRLRATRPFLQAVLLSALFFSAAHLFLLAIYPPLFVALTIVLAVIVAFPFSYFFEQGGNTIWRSAIIHTVIDAAAFIVVLAPEVKGRALSLYLLVSIGATYVVYVLSSRLFPLQAGSQCLLARLHAWQGESSPAELFT
jgi:membrane protease YdiL (CAAX protease family)